jgi:hypothetical protein
LTGEVVIKVYSILALLVILTAVSSAGDWLEGGNVGRGSYSEIRQHFTDPIFYSASSNYVSSDPAIRQMEESMDRYSNRYASLGSTNAKSTMDKSTIGRSSASASAVGKQPLNAAGNWHLELSDGTSMDLGLHQSGSRVFGVGSMTTSNAVQWAVASGDITGSGLNLEVVPASGTTLYAISLDVSRLHLPGSYTVFNAAAAQNSGNVVASRIATSIMTTGHDTAKSAIGNVRG